jgi:phosphotransferase system HPr (HPr) family protein
LFVKLALKFESKIEVVKGHERVDGKSILAILTLAATAGTELTIVAIGPDAQQAVNDLAELAGSDFAENECER